jgi:hypothetical protein
MLVIWYEFPRKYKSQIYFVSLDTEKNLQIKRITLAVPATAQAPYPAKPRVTPTQPPILSILTLPQPYIPVRLSVLYQYSCYA